MGIRGIRRGIIIKGIRRIRGIRGIWAIRSIRGIRGIRVIRGIRSKGIRVLGVGVQGVLWILVVLWEASGRYLEGLWEASSGHLGTLGGLGALGTFEVHSLSLKWGQTAASDHSTAEWRR